MVIIHLPALLTECVTGLSYPRVYDKPLAADMCNIYCQGGLGYVRGPESDVGSFAVVFYLMHCLLVVPNLCLAPALLVCAVMALAAGPAPSCARTLCCISLHRNN